MPTLPQLPEKTEVCHVEADEKLNTATDYKYVDENGAPGEAVVEPEVEKRIIRKIDGRLLPILTALYTFALVDRTNIGVARISGLDKATQLDVGTRASVAILVFYIGYCLMEIPSNIAMKRFGAANWLCFIATGWGLLTLAIGFSKNWQTLAVLRAFLGVLEAGLTPGCLYLIASWYRRYEVQTRISIFFVCAQFLSSFSNILAYGLIQVASDPETGGWKYIYIIEGAITVGVAILSRFIIIDFPDSKRNKFLSAEEIATVKGRLMIERGTAEAGKVTWKVIWGAITDWPIWAASIMYMSGACSIYGFLIFLPIILRKGLGYSLVLSFVLTAPPAAFSVIYAIGMSKLSDRYKMRGPFMMGHAVLAITGLAMIGFLDQSTPRYVGAFLGEAGTNGVIVTGMAWCQNNIRSDEKRSVGTAIQIIVAGIGGVYSALVFRQQDSPDYVPGLIAIGAVMLLTIAMTPVVCFFLRRANKQADAGTRLIEDSPGFRYTI
ncbi:hypothetical protein H2200_000261 [Cladophialophora chaetospira]|uniref:Major facilitator superfamily (MFS) profile domain-containing protein n=1 Tax=Cladophialophora chaetospira TaxID=386627 RepID=A0AA39CQ60_9EURO|nr:hypothetical protein H2200_000261 [Cladophialophora chaetospira]